MPLIIHAAVATQESPTLDVIFNVIYWSAVIIILLDVFSTYIRKKLRKPHVMTEKDFDKLLSGQFTHIIMPIWADTTLSEFNSLALTYHAALQQVLIKNRDYVSTLKPLDRNSEDYKHIVDAEMEIVSAMGSLASEVCNKFTTSLNKGPIGYSECPHSVVCKYISLVRMYRNQYTYIQSAEFIPDDLREKYLQILGTLQDLFKIIDGTIQLS